MQCFSSLNPDASGYSSTLLPGDAICSAYIGCINSGEVISIDDGNNSTVRCQDFNNAAVPGCVNACVYIPPNLAPTEYRLPEFQYLFASYFYLQKDNFFVSLEYTPCPLDNTNSYYPDGVQAIKDGSGSLFADCLAFTGSQLENFVAAVAIDSLDAANNTNLYQISNTCLASTIANNSNLLLFFKPRAVQYSPNEYRCCILAVLGKSWIGYLAYQNNQHDPHARDEYATQHDGRCTSAALHMRATSAGANDGSRTNQVTRRLGPPLAGA